MRTCLFTIIFVCLGMHSQAQVDGPVRYLAPSSHIPKSKNYFDLGFHPPVVHDGRIYTLTSDQDKQGVDWRRWFLHAYTHDQQGSVASSELTPPELERGYKYRILQLFMAGDRPAVLYRIWEGTTGVVSLYVQATDAGTLQADGPPVKIGEMHLNPRGYTEQGPDVKVMPSPDGSMLLFYCDKLTLEFFQMVMCWVTRSDLEPRWNGVYRVPAQSYGYEGEVHFADDAAVYMWVNAVVVTEDRVKEKKDGSQQAKVVSPTNKEKAQYYKLRGEEFLSWDGSLPDGWEQKEGRLAVSGSEVYVAGLARKGDAKQGRHWFLVRLDEAMQPVDFDLQALQTADVRDPKFKSFVIDDNGNKYLVGREWSRVVVKAIDAGGGHRWESKFGMIAWRDPQVFMHNGALRIGTVCSSEQVGHERRGSLVDKRKVDFGWSVLVTFDEQGKTFQEALFKRADGGHTRNPAHLDFLNIQRGGYFVDRTYKSDKPGVLVVPVR